MFKKYRNKIITGILGITAVGGGGVITVDNQINPYTEKGSEYQLEIQTELPQDKLLYYEDRIKIHKDKPMVDLSRWNNEMRITIEPILQNTIDPALKTKMQTLIDKLEPHLVAGTEEKSPTAVEEEKNKAHELLTQIIEEDNFDPAIVSVLDGWLNYEAGYSIKSAESDYAIKEKINKNLQSHFDNRKATRPLLTNRVEFEQDDKVIFVKPRSDTEFDIDFRLNSKPDTNVFEYKITGAEDYDFDKQSNGSYTVYHKTKANHREGQTNYGTGKAMHIYRPEAIDDDGVKTWAVLDYSNGILSVTVPQAFLDTAKYPVIVDPTFGYDSVGQTEDTTSRLYLDNGATEYSYRNGIIVAGNNADILSISVYIQDDSQNDDFDGSLSVYVNEKDSDGADSHGTLVSAEITSGIVYGDWNTITVATTTIFSGTDYIINASAMGKDAPAGEIFLPFDSGGYGSLINFYSGSTPAEAYANSKVDPIDDAPDGTTRRPSIYATYTTDISFDDYTYCQVVTMESDNISTTTTSGFVVLATTTQSTLAATSSSGTIEVTEYDSANNLETPIDLVFTEGTDCQTGGTLLDYHHEFYATTTGELVSWVESMDVSSTTDKTFLMYYGDSDAVDYSNETGTYLSSDVAVWHLPEDPSGTAPQMLDSTQYNNDGTSAGTMTTSDQVAGQVDGSLDFDGSNDHIDIGTNPSFTGDITISAWVKHDGDTGYIIEKEDDVGFSLRVNDTTEYISFFDGGWYHSSEAISLNTWTHIAITGTGTSGIIYVDGVQVDTFSFSAIADHSSVNGYIGIQNGLYSSWDGIMDELRLYNRALDAGEILTIYNYGVDNATFLSFGAETEVTPPASGEADATDLFLLW